MELDEVDRTILRNLREDSRMSLQEISRRSGIADATVQFRLKRMKSQGVIERFTISASPTATGYTVTAIMLVQTDSESHDQAVQALILIPEITEVYGILGEYDLFLKVWSHGLEELKTIINERIRSVEGIENLLEIVVLDRVKEESPPV